MRRIIILIAFLLMPGAALADCGDDPRLMDLPSLLESGSLPTRPFYLLPETFVRLQPAVRKALGDAIVICPKNPVKNGVPVHPARLKLDFGVIWQAMEEAINMNDWENVEFLRDCAQPADLEPEAAFSLLVIPALSKDDAEKLMKILNIVKLKNAKGNQAVQLFLADIFAGLVVSQG